jgi:hypothetical protein
MIHHEDINPPSSRYAIFMMTDPNLSGKICNEKAIPREPQGCVVHRIWTIQSKVENLGLMAEISLTNFYRIFENSLLFESPEFLEYNSRISSKSDH